jgi:predicted dehydrogenase
MGAGQKLAYGLIGLGRINRAHLEGLRRASDVASIVAVCDVDRGAAERVAAECGAQLYTDYRELLKDSRIAVVDIALPHNLHFEVANAALAAGKHVLLEKPMAPTVRECEDLIALAKARGLTLSVAHHGRFVTAYLEVQRLLNEGAIGTPRLIRTLIYGSEFRYLTDASHWRSRAAGSIGGAIMDSGPHSIFLLKWLFGEIETLRAFTEKLIDASEVEDNAIVTGRLKSGTLFTTQYTFTAENFFSERLEVYGSKGTLVIDQLRDPPAIFYHGEKDLTGEVISSIRFDPSGWKFHAQVDGVEAFAKAVSRGEAPPVDPWDAAYVIKVIETAYASVRSGGSIVRV